MNPSKLAVYREQGKKTWLQVNEVQHLQLEKNLRDGVTISFECKAFGNRRFGEFQAEFLLLERHEFSIEVRLAPKVILEYSQVSLDQNVLVRAKICNDGIFPKLEHNNYVRIEDGMMHYTTKEGRVNEFLTLTTNNELYLEGSTIRGAQMLVPLETESLKLGRSSNSSRSQVAMTMTPPPTRNWFERIFKRV